MDNEHKTVGRSLDETTCWILLPPCILSANNFKIKLNATPPISEWINKM